jgi:very-short-patch-repair endonuclease
MTPPRFQEIRGEAWKLARAQHDVITHTQLRELGYTIEAIRHRLRSGRLFVLWPGVYAVGRPNVTRLGRWKAATLACGPQSALCGESGAALLNLRPRERPAIEIAVPERTRRSLRGIEVRRGRDLADHVTRVHDIPVCSTPLLLVQLSARLGRDSIEEAINRADKLDLIDPETLRTSLEALRGRPGVARLRGILDRATFRLSDSQLERRFRPIARRAGLPAPEMGEWVNGVKVDFWWPALNLVVETDGLRFHRTPITQTRDLRRDHAHDRAGTWHLRFSHAQIAYEPGYVQEQLEIKHRQIEALVQSVGR